jgi:hypothetical protein
MSTLLLVIVLDSKLPSRVDPSQLLLMLQTGNSMLEEHSRTVEPALTTESLSLQLHPLNGPSETLGVPDGESLVTSNLLREILVVFV